MGRALIVSAIHGERYGISSSRWVIPLIFHQNSCVVLEQPKYLYLPPTPVQLIFSTLWLLTLSAEIHRRNFRGLTKVYCGQCRFGGFLEELSSKQGLRAPAEIPLSRSTPCPAGGRGGSVENRHVPSVTVRGWKQLQRSHPSRRKALSLTHLAMKNFHSAVKMSWVLMVVSKTHKSHFFFLNSIHILHMHN